uniref:Uncharacterized protein n=1 Tax=Anguilla anguilla TaxID=7936 RepID=A0A0E9SHK8_ANGAN
MYSLEIHLMSWVQSCSRGKSALCVLSLRGLCLLHSSSKFCFSLRVCSQYLFCQSNGL